MISRHDFTKNQRWLLNRAVRIGLMDAFDLGVLLAVKGNDFDAIKSEVSEYAWVLRNGCESEQKTRSLWIQACEVYKTL
jgi:hypothetical protein